MRNQLRNLAALSFVALLILLSPRVGSAEQQNNDLPQEHVYSCVSKDSSGEYIRLVINASGNSEILMIDGEYADFDPNYSPLSTERVRFIYRNNQEGTNLIVIPNTLRRGAQHGVVALQWRGDAFTQTFYDCNHL